MGGKRFKSERKKTKRNQVRSGEKIRFLNKNRDQGKKETGKGAGRK